MQIPGTIQILAKRFPGVPIVYNIVSRGSPSDVVRQELETELRKLQAGIDVENDLALVITSSTPSFPAGIQV